jgi:hypothetical protein
MALGSTQPVTDMSTRNFPGDKGGWKLRLTTLLASVHQMSRKCGSLNVPQAYRPLQPDTGIALLFYGRKFI